MWNLRQIRHPHPGFQEEQLLRKKIPFVVVLHQQFGSGTESMRVNMLAGLLKEQNRPSPEMAVASRQGPYVSVSFHNVFRQALQSAQSSSHQRHSLSQRKRCHASGWYNLMAVATQSVGPVRLPLNQVRPWAQRTESAEPKSKHLGSVNLMYESHSLQPSSASWTAFWNAGLPSTSFRPRGRKCVGVGASCRLATQLLSMKDFENL